MLRTKLQVGLGARLFPEVRFGVAAGKAKGEAASLAAHGLAADHHRLPADQIGIAGETIDLVFFGRWGQPRFFVFRASLLRYQPV